MPVAKSLLAVVNGKEDGSDFIPVSRRQKSKLSVPPLPLERFPLYRTANHHRKIVPGCRLLPPPYRVLLILRKTIICEWNDQGAHNFSQEVAPSQKVDISLWSPDIAQIDRAFINGYCLPYYAIEKSIPDGNMFRHMWYEIPDTIWICDYWADLGQNYVEFRHGHWVSCKRDLHRLHYRYILHCIHMTKCLIPLMATWYRLFLKVLWV